MVVLAGSPAPLGTRVCRDVARRVYGRLAVPASIDEASAATLCGTTASKALAELRSHAQPDAPTATDRAVLVALAGATGAGTLALLAVGSDTAEIRLARVRGADVTFDALRLRADLAPTTDDAAFERAATSLADGVVARAEANVAPMRSEANNATLPKPATEPVTEPATEPSSWWSTPWPWVALGGLVAAGVTVVVLSQTATTDTSIVQVRGTMPTSVGPLQAHIVPFPGLRW